MSPKAFSIVTTCIIQPFCLWENKLFKMCLIQCLPQGSIVIRTVWVQVVPQTPRENNRILEKLFEKCFLWTFSQGQRLSLVTNVKYIVTWGMIDSCLLRVCRPMWDISTLSSIIFPPAGSISLNRASAREDLPAPVLPTTPTFKGKRKPFCATKYFLYNDHLK